MEIASAINGIIERLHSKETELNSKIESDQNECNRLKKIIDELQTKVDVLNTVITNSKAELTSLKKTIFETEDGYSKITEAGKTLMAIVEGNLPKIKKIHTKAEDILEVPDLERPHTAPR